MALSQYTDKKAELICELISRGKSLRQICELDDFPSISTVHYWLRSNEEFQNHYARACEMRADFIFEQIQEIAFDDSRDVTGELQMPNAVAVQRDRLKVDSLKWMLGKMMPKKYGDKLEVDHTGEVTLSARIAGARKRGQMIEAGS